MLDGTHTLGTTDSFEKMSGHWVLARLGKRVLRPGGRQLTEAMLSSLAIDGTDDVVELAPGIGITAAEVLKYRPRSYIGVDADAAVVRRLSTIYRGLPDCGFTRARAQESGLPDSSASVILGEAFLTMQAGSAKAKIIGEMARILRPGGRVGLHELCVSTEDPEQIEALRRELTDVIRVNAQPISVQQWKGYVEDAGLVIESVQLRPMELLHVKRLIDDEGAFGAIRIAWNMARNPKALKRVIAMRRVFEKYIDVLGAIQITASKPNVTARLI